MRQKRQADAIRLRGGMYLGLHTPEQITRAKQLVRKHPRKYEIDHRFPYGDPSPTPLLYFLAHPEPEGQAIQAWIETGQGAEPS
jgi:hypothetical protein